MAHNLPPTRLWADPQAPEALRALVDHARADLPSAATMTRFTARLDGAISANVQPPDISPPIPNGTTSGIAGGKALVLGAGLLVVGAIVGGASYVAHNLHKPPSVSVSGAPLVELPPPEPTLVVASPLTSAPPPPTSATKEPADVSAPRKPVAAAAQVSEATLLDTARAALGSDPKRALRLTREHARRFPNGNLVQEREVIAIEALRRLGQSDAARARGNSFAREYPDSAHQSKVDQILEAK